MSDLNAELVNQFNEQKKKLENPLGFLLTKDGVIKKNSIKNIVIILEHDEAFKNLFKFNEFTKEVDIVKNSPILKIHKGRMLDKYYPIIAEYIESSRKYHHVLFNQNNIADAVSNVADKYSYNPIIDYFEKCYENYDNIQRLHNVFTEFLGVEYSDLTTLIAKLFFVGAVAKAYDPKTKFDFVLDLVGGQGAGKTTFLQKIAPLGYYTDQFTRFDNKDDYAVMRRALIINDDEMTATRSASFEVLKKFITLREFEYRKAYGREAERFDKNFVMARTTNERYYLKDKTGERRFLPILADKDKQSKHPVEDLEQDYIDQLWGEAVSLYKNGFSFKLSEEESEALEVHRQDFQYTDEIEDRIEMLMENEFKNRDFITSREIARFVSPGTELTKDRKLANQISNIMINRFGAVKKDKKIQGKSVKGYKL